MPVFPAPAIPVFPAGGPAHPGAPGPGPLPADFTTWVQNPFGFATNEIMFRGLQSNSQQMSNSLFTALQIDTVREDPYQGWSQGGTAQQPAWSWLAPWTGWYEITVSIPIRSNPTWISSAVLISAATNPFWLDDALCPADSPGGCDGCVTVALTGGVDCVQGGAAVPVTVSTSTDTGRNPALEITYVSAG